MKYAIIFISILACGACLAAEVKSPEFVDIKNYSPGVAVEMPYATKNNFTGEKLYEFAVCLLRPEVAASVAAAQAEFDPLGYRLVMLDCYRPKSISMKMWKAGEKHNERCRAMGKACRASGCDPGEPDCLWEPLTNYLSRASVHNTGAAVDVTLMKAGKKIAMGSEFDCFGDAARTKSATGKILENRLLLKKVMERHGFVNYYREWWHYNHVSHNKSPQVDLSFSEIIGAGGKKKWLEMKPGVSEFK